MLNSPDAFLQILNFISWFLQVYAQLCCSASCFLQVGFVKSFNQMGHNLKQFVDLLINSHISQKLGFMIQRSSFSHISFKKMIDVSWWMVGVYDLLSRLNFWLCYTIFVLMFWYIMSSFAALQKSKQSIFLLLLYLFIIIYIIIYYT